MAQYKPPNPLNFSEPNWPKWKALYETFRLLTDLQHKRGEIQVASLKYCLGPEAEDVVKTFNLSEEDSKKYEVVIAKFDSYFTPRKNVLRLRRTFYRRIQRPQEDTEAYLRALFVAAEDCGFRDKDEHIRDQFVAGIVNEDLAEKLEMLYFSKDGNLSLSDVVEYSRTYNDVHEGRKLEREMAKVVEEVKSKPSGNVKAGQSKSDRSCNFCGRAHEPRKCPAYGKRCNKCKRLNHFSIVCKQKVSKIDAISPEGDDGASGMGEAYGGGNWDKVKRGEPDANFAEAFLGECSEIGNPSRSTGPWRVPVKVGQSEVVFKVDSGADVTLINHRTYHHLVKVGEVTPLENARVTLNSPAGAIPVKGKVGVELKYKSKVVSEVLYVMAAERQTDNLLSRQASVALGLILFVGDVNIKEDIFGFGVWDTEEVDLRVKPGAVPYSVRVARSIAIPLREAVRKNLNALEDQGVIEKVTHPTNWLSPVVPVVKPHSSPVEVRICCDYKFLNQHLQREVFEIPTFEELVSNLSGAVKFSKLDAKSGFYQIPLKEEARDLTTFITPFGRYRYRRLPMGINVAPEIFQRKMTELLKDLPGVICYLDDILVYGSCAKDHDDNLDRVLKRIQACGLKLNREKCIFGQAQINFLGHLVGAEGIQIDPEKVKAILALEAPSNVKGLRRMLGMVNYLTRFLPHVQSVIQPLNLLLSSKVAWQWGPEQEAAMSKLKRILTTAPVLSYFDPKLPTIVSADASESGLGGTLLQKKEGQWKPVAYCSRMLSDTEKRWAQIEKECLAAVWSCERLQQFLTGLVFTLQTDHKPLIPLINSKELSLAPARCQRLLMRLSRFSPRAEYVPGKFLVVADNLSRAPTKRVEGDVERPGDDIISAVEAHVGSLVQCVPATPSKIDQIKCGQLQDPCLSKVISYTLQGWPEDFVQEDRVGLAPYWAARSHLSVIDSSLLVYGSRLVIPMPMRKDILSRIHDDGHLCLQKCRQRIQDSVWWPGISQDLKIWIDKCSFCQRNSRQQHAEPLKPSMLPERPWSKIGMDLCYMSGKDYLVVVDYFSRWLEIVQLEDTTTTVLVQKVKNMFARWGIPDEVRSDNGPQFTSSIFRDFSREYGFVHTTSDPHYPQGNGAAERGVQTAKRILKQKDPFLALMTYRATVLDTTGCSPAQLIMGRNIRTRLPVVKSQLYPRWPDLVKVAEKDATAKLKRVQNYNTQHGARALPLIPPGNDVLVQNPIDRTWDEVPTSVNGKVGNRSYLVRNRRHIKQLVGEPVMQSRQEPRQNVATHSRKSLDKDDNTNEPIMEPVLRPEEAGVNPPPQVQPETRTRSGRVVRKVERLDL